MTSRSSASQQPYPAWALLSQGPRPACDAPGSPCVPPNPSPQAVSRRVKVTPAERMSKFLRHFTVVGDDYHSWNINYKKWENEEDEDEEQPPATPASGEEGTAAPTAAPTADPEAAPSPAPRPPLDVRSWLRKLFSSHRFQVGGAKVPWRRRGMGEGRRRGASHEAGPSWAPSPLGPCSCHWHRSHTPVTCHEQGPCCQGRKS